jgi:hypothetical protein
MKTRRSDNVQTSPKKEVTAEDRMRLPHEHDESSRQTGTPPRRVIKRAHQDLTTGRVDTDERGLKAARAFDNSQSAARMGRTSSTTRDRNRQRSRP